MKTTNTLSMNTNNGVVASSSSMLNSIATTEASVFSYWISMAILALVIIIFFIPLVWYGINYGLANVV